MKIRSSTHKRKLKTQDNCKTIIVSNNNNNNNDMDKKKTAYCLRPQEAA